MANHCRQIAGDTCRYGKLIADQFGVPAAALLPPAHQPPPQALAAPVPSRTDALLATLPQLEAGAVSSILHVLAARPDLIIPVMTTIEQHAAPEPEGRA